MPRRMTRGAVASRKNLKSVAGEGMFNFNALLNACPAEHGAGRDVQMADVVNPSGVAHYMVLEAEPEPMDIDSNDVEVAVEGNDEPVPMEIDTEEVPTENEENKTGKGKETPSTDTEAQTQKQEPAENTVAAPGTIEAPTTEPEQSWLPLSQNIQSELLTGLGKGEIKSITLERSELKVSF